MEEKFVLSIDDICKRYKIELIYDNTFIQNCPRCGGQVERKNISNIRISNLKSTPAAERRIVFSKIGTHIRGRSYMFGVAYWRGEGKIQEKEEHRGKMFRRNMDETRREYTKIHDC